MQCYHFKISLLFVFNEVDFKVIYKTNLGFFSTVKLFFRFPFVGLTLLPPLPLKILEMFITLIDLRLILASLISFSDIVFFTTFHSFNMCKCLVSLLWQEFGFTLFLALYLMVIIAFSLECCF